jgi:hypothetical protein
LAPSPATYVWDLWLLPLGEQLHMFRLESGAEVAPAERHHHAVRIVHFRGDRSLRRWSRVGVALAPGPESSWDGLALWSGCCVSDGRQAHLFYTARGRERFWWQQVGVATSPLPDLGAWTRSPHPLLSPAGGDYELPEGPNSLGTAPAWRDPWVGRLSGGGWRMLLTARDRRRPGPWNGCVAELRSSDLARWQAHEPFFSPGLFDEVELPELLERDGTEYLFFSTPERALGPAWQARFGDPAGAGGLHCWLRSPGDRDFRPANGDGVVRGLAAPQVYGVRLVEGPGGALRGLGWCEREPGSDRFSGALVGPLELLLDGEGVKLAA